MTALARLLTLLFLISSGPVFAVSFIFFGDAGTGTESQYRVASGIKSFCASHRCDFVAMLGDNFLPAGVQSITDFQWGSKFFGPYASLGLVFYPVIGNHDALGNIDAQLQLRNYSSIWRMEGRYYRFEKEDVSFYALDTENFDGLQKQWLETELSKDRNRWKIAFGHRPVFSFGFHGSEDKLIESLLPVLKKKKVAFYLAGHEHDKQVLYAERVLFTICGTGGNVIRPVRMGVISLYASSSYGFCHLDISGNKALLRVLNDQGKVQFEYPVQK